ncbi:MAG: MFS transporter [Jatrophihabitans sp.]
MSFTDAGRPAGRDLYLAVAARALSLLGDEVALVALLLRAQAGGGGAWPVAELLLAGLLPLMLLAPLVGRLVDRTDSRRLLLVSSVAQLACCLVLAYRSDLPSTLLLVAGLGAGQAVNAATWQALLPAIVGLPRLPAALGLSQAASTAASVLAPVLGGLLTGSYGTRLPLLLDAASFGAVAVAALAVRTRRRGRRTGTAEDARGGWAILRSDRTLLLLVLMLGLFILLGSMVNVVEVFLVRQSLHASATWYGLIGGCWGVGAFTGALLGRRASSQRTLLRLALLSCTLLGLSLAGMGVAPTVGWVLPAGFAGGTANGLVSLTISALLALRSP